MTPQTQPTIFTLDPTSKPDPSRLSSADTPPPWRKYGPKASSGTVPRVARKMQAGNADKGRSYRGKPIEEAMVSAALLLRRPLLITGPAGAGKSSLAYAVAWRLGLGNVLRWGVTSRSVLKDALYHYDAIGRLNETSRQKAASHGDTEIASTGSSDDIGRFIKLGPLGTALLPTLADGYFPRVLLIDEIDKSDADLPSDLLHVLEEGNYHVPEIGRLAQSRKELPVTVATDDPDLPTADIPVSGWVQCDDFPLIIMTSNGEREFSPAFLRRCLPLTITRDRSDLEAVLEAHLGAAANTAAVQSLLAEFVSADATLSRNATDQLLNVAQLITLGFDFAGDNSGVKQNLLRPLDDSSSQTRA